MIVDLRYRFGTASKWLPLLVAGAVIGAVVAFGVSNAQPRVYEAKATLIVGQALEALNPDVNQLIVSQRLSATYAAIATKRPALEHVIGKLGLQETPDQLARHVWAEAPTESTLLTLTAQDTDPATAASIANELAELLIASSPAIQGLDSELQASIEAEIMAIREQIQITQARVEDLVALESPQPGELATLDALQGRLVTLRSTYASLLASSARNAANLLTVIEPAIAPTDPVSPRVLLSTILGLVVGFLLAAGAAALIEYLDDRVKNAEAVQELTGLSTLGAVARMDVDSGRPELYRLATLLHPRSAVAEAYRTLRSNIEFASVDAPISTLVVTSAGANEGKTVTAANLAVAFAQAGRRTILVDADLRQPGVGGIFGLPNDEGLTTMLRDESTSVTNVAHTTEQVNLRVITTGPLPPNPAELLGSQRMRATIEKLKGQGELIIFDTPPVQVVIDAAVLSSYLDAAVLVVDASRSRRGGLRDAREALTRASANVLGVILNRVPEAARSSTYGAYYEDHPGASAGSRTTSTERSPT